MPGATAQSVPPDELQRRERTLYLVGDRIQEQSDHPGLLSISALERMLEMAPPPAPHSLYCRLVVGQGVAESRLIAAYERLRRHPLAELMRLEPSEPQVKASCAHTHKHCPANIIIADPQWCGGSLYRGRLLIDESCAEMSDHLTGVHVQGMVIIEAARQMLLATTEKFHICDEHRQAIRFVTHTMNMTFNEFIYPLPVGINQTLRIVRRTGPISFKADTTVSFFQSSCLAAQVHAEYSVIPEKHLSARELSRFRDLIGLQTAVS